MNTTMPKDMVYLPNRSQTELTLSFAYAVLCLCVFASTGFATVDTPTPTPTPCAGDTDCDGIPNNQDSDIDGDGIPNVQDNDIDGDGTPNDQDDDIDGDGIPNGSDPSPDGCCGSPGNPNPTDTPVPTDTPTPTNTPTPTPYIVITKPVTPASDLWIYTVPIMPYSYQTECGAEVENWSGGQVTYNWTYSISYTYTYSGGERTTSANFAGVSYGSGPSYETTWSPDFGSTLCGGDVTITVSASADGQSFGSESLEDAYKIKGVNPAEAFVMPYIGTGPWYAQRVGRHESGYTQFVGSGMPLVSTDGGVGIFQITNSPPPATEQHWHWKANVDNGKSRLASAQATADTFVSSQINQWEQWNQQEGNGLHDNPPSNTTYNDITFALYPSGAQKDYRDAGALKRFNGLGTEGHAFLVWKNDVAPYIDNPEWKTYPSATTGNPPTVIYYVQSVCNTSP